MDNLFKSAIRVALFFSAACLLLWAVIPGWRSVFAGLLLGIGASVMNALLLKRRVELVGQVVPDGSKRRMGLGLGSRMATVLLAAMIAYKYPETFNMPATLAACMMMPFIILVSASIYNKRH
ncbi:ATP synthase subunit I [Paenibacillus sp. GSMTC-2017]|uniref:ATP synthase subunit I n=1 Tax=Paenibacillus sp. GSMTC-2017 TaxID=2794350 RepID=UPI0018D9B173|nr:ATP synthase subunit I [Paenibacillus sp. GSMTC-2017]MBH5320561.1 ATP synthase subunit I [Paenibacillus sp. GSMTC-2017]